MSDKQVEKSRASLVVKQEAELRAEVAELRAKTADCYSPECPCHEAEWRSLSTALFLLGEDIA
jgi:hypothetical protein